VFFLSTPRWLLRLATVLARVRIYRGLSSHTCPALLRRRVQERAILLDMLNPPAPRNLRAALPRELIPSPIPAVAILEYVMNPSPVPSPAVTELTLPCHTSSRGGFISTLRDFLGMIAECVVEKTSPTSLHGQGGLDQSSAQDRGHQRSVVCRPRPHPGKRPLLPLTRNRCEYVPIHATISLPFLYLLGFVQNSCWSARGGF